MAANSEERRVSSRAAEGARALKERIYSTFTGLSVLAAISIAGHTTAPEAFLALAVAVFGITSAGFVAEVVAFQIAHREYPRGKELRVMARIALGALGSALLPLLVLAVAWAGVMELEWALWFGIAIYAATLVVVLLVAGMRSGLRPRQRFISTAMLLGLAVVVIVVLLVAHSH